MFVVPVVVACALLAMADLTASTVGAGTPLPDHEGRAGLVPDVLLTDLVTDGVDLNSIAPAGTGADCDRGGTERGGTETL